MVVGRGLNLLNLRMVCNSDASAFLPQSGSIYDIHYTVDNVMLGYSMQSQR